MKKKDRLLFIGDSLIEFFDWESRFPDYEVFNLGIAGETVNGLYRRLDRIFETAGEPSCIFIMTGINNLAMGDTDIIKTYTQVIDHITRRLPSSALHVHSLLPVLFPMISNDEVRDFNRQLKRLAEERGVRYIDIHSRFVGSGGRAVASYLEEDGVHVSPTGYGVWSGLIEEVLDNK